MNGLKSAPKRPRLLEKAPGIFPSNFATVKNFMAEFEAGLELIDVLIFFSWLRHAAD